MAKISKKKAAQNAKDAENKRKKEQQRVRLPVLL